MRKFIPLLLAALISSTALAEPITAVKSSIDNITNPDNWISNMALKYGTLTGFCLAQGLTGLTEGYHFNGNSGYVVNESNYHAYDTARRVSWIGVGYLTYANIQDPHQKRLDKVRRILGASFVARDFNEWFYKWQRYNNPFDWSKARNEHAIVYFKVTRAGITDAYIGTGPLSGPLVDLGCLIFGLLLYK